MGREGIGAISRDRLEDGISALGPDERLGLGIVGLNESGDVGLEVLDTAMDAALDLLVGEQREPAFDLIKPGGAGRREVQVTARVAGEPDLDRRRLVWRMTLSTLPSPILRGTPGRGSSSSPSRPRSTKRRRHFPTVCGVTRSCAATALLLSPAAQPNTMRARSANACAVLRRCV